MANEVCSRTIYFCNSVLISTPRAKNDIPFFKFSTHFLTRPWLLHASSFTLLGVLSVTKLEHQMLFIFKFYLKFFTSEVQMKNTIFGSAYNYI
jgi:hypothetical protein